jgi:hypothetical protein
VQKIDALFRVVMGSNGVVQVHGMDKCGLRVLVRPWDWSERGDHNRILHHYAALSFFFPSLVLLSPNVRANFVLFKRLSVSCHSMTGGA